MKKAATKRERDHLAWVKSQPCIVCELLGQPQQGVTDAHHIREGQGMSQRGGHFTTIPLCHDGCHQGPDGVHGTKVMLKIARVTEMDLLNLLVERIAMRKSA